MGFRPIMDAATLVISIRSDLHSLGAADMLRLELRKIFLNHGDLRACSCRTRRCRPKT